MLCLLLERKTTSFFFFFFPNRLLTVEQLQRYLSLKLESNNPFVMSLTDRQQEQQEQQKEQEQQEEQELVNLTASLTLGHVEGTLWKQSTPMVLFYACVP